jgi:uncharacterized protein (DUF2147 family)
MRNYALAAALGVLTAAFLAPCGQSQAASGDPSGFWYKPDAERESKIQVFKCGRGKTQLCAKIVWLKNPNDSTGKALHDVRNENPSMRGRPIVGLPLFTNMAQSAPETWSGQIYNPEDGHTYSATLTLISRTEIKLRGCKAWLLCGEKQWLKTSAPEVVVPAAPAEGTQQIEASAEPPNAPASAVASPEPQSAAVESSNVEAAAVPAPTTVATGKAQAMAEPASAPAAEATAVVSKAEVATPVTPPAEQNAQPGYGFLAVSTSPDAARVSGENVPSMIDMTKPIAPEAPAAPAGGVATAAANPAPANATSAQSDVETASQADESVPLPAQKPKVKLKPKPIATASAAKPLAKPEVRATAPVQAAPVPQVPQDTATVQADPDAQAADAQQPAAAEASMAEAPPLTRRQLRKLRRQQMQEEPFLPWLRSAN